jgi:hypothetical protein
MQKRETLAHPGLDHVRRSDRSEAETCRAHTPTCAVCARPIRPCIRLVVQKCQGSACTSAEAASHSVKVIHPHIRPFGSYGSAEVPTWSTIDMYDWAKPSRSPIFAENFVRVSICHRRAGLQRHDRPTVARRYFHQTRLGNRCNRWSLRALQRACARSCSNSPSMRYSQLTIMGGAAYPRALSTRDLRGRGVAHGRPTGKPTAEGSETMIWAGRPASLACSGDRQLKR